MTSAPITSLDWNVADPTLLGTSSIDTTCTIWNVQVCLDTFLPIDGDGDETLSPVDVLFQHFFDASRLAKLKRS